ncbi:MAG: ThuA domain-containing protein [Gemmataceae bacterium]
MRRGIVGLVLIALFAAGATSEEPAPLKIHLIGVGEYEAAKSMTAFKKHLEDCFHVACTASVGGNGKKLENLEPLASADVLVIFARRTNLPEEQMKLIRSHWEKGKPIVAMRTASHAFQPADNEIFDKKVLGGDYKGSGSYTTPFKALPVESQADHPVLKDVGPITSRGYYNNGKLAADVVVLQLVETTSKTPRPVTWTHTYNGGRTLYTSMGTPEDFKNDAFLRLLTNAVFWTAQRNPDQLKK